MLDDIGNSIIMMQWIYFLIISMQDDTGMMLLYSRHQEGRFERNGPCESFYLDDRVGSNLIHADAGLYSVDGLFRLRCDSLLFQRNGPWVTHDNKVGLLILIMKRIRFLLTCVVADGVALFKITKWAVYLGDG